MIEKTTVFNKLSLSYSQFLQSTHEVQTLNEQTPSFINYDFFRRSVTSHYQSVYTSKIMQNWLYRLIFFGFSVFFIILAIVIYFKTTNFLCGLYFTNSFMIKNCVNGFCLILANLSFAAGYMIQPKREAIRYLIGKVERELNSTAKSLQSEFNSIFRTLSDEWSMVHQMNNSIKNRIAYAIA